MTLHRIFTPILFMLITGCGPRNESSTTSGKYTRWIDDIPFDESLDNNEFTLCHSDDKAYQYFNDSRGLEFEGEKYAIIKAFEENYEASKAAKESGLIRIRFLVNCRGESGRFRVLSTDENYKEKKFDKSITNQLLEITKNLKGWKPKIIGGQTIDYYQYLIFKIQKGKIVKILP